MVSVYFWPPHMYMCVCELAYVNMLWHAHTHIHFFWFVQKTGHSYASFFLFVSQKKKSDGDADDTLCVVIRNTAVNRETSHDVVVHFTAVPQEMKQLQRYIICLSLFFLFCSQIVVPNVLDVFVDGQSILAVKIFLPSNVTWLGTRNVLRQITCSCSEQRLP